MSQSNFDRLLQKYLAGECTDEEEKLVLEWYGKMIHNSDLHLSEADRSLLEDRMWQSIQANIQAVNAQPAPVRPLPARTWLRVTAAAAVLALIATTLVLYRHQTNNTQQLAGVPGKAGYDSLVNEKNTERKIRLSDSSLITLQPGATVYYPAAFMGATREVYLKGSAFFNVHHNPAKHFKVHLNDGLTTEVLGTSFNISQNPTDRNIEVAVVTGKVLVYRNAGSVVLTRNKKVTFNAVRNQLVTGIVDNPQPLPKTVTQHSDTTNTNSTQFAFEETPLQNVLQSLSDAYGILINTENEQLGKRHFTGNLSKYSLFTQLEYICKTTQTTYEINGSQIILKDTRTGNP